MQGYFYNDMNLVKSRKRSEIIEFIKENARKGKENLEEQCGKTWSRTKRYY